MEVKGNLNIFDNAAVGFETAAPTFTDARLQVKGAATGDAATEHNIWATDSAGNDIFEVMDNGNTLIRNGGLFIGDTGAAVHPLVRLNTNLDFYIQHRATSTSMMMLASDLSGADRVVFRVNPDGGVLSYAETGLDDQFRITAHDALNANRDRFSIWADMDTSSEPKWRIGDYLQLSSIDGARAKIQAFSRNLNFVHADGYAFTGESATGNGVMSLKSAGTTATPADAAKIGTVDAASSLLLIGHVGPGGNSTINFGALIQRNHFINTFDTRIEGAAVGTLGGQIVTTDTEIFRIVTDTGNRVFITAQDGRVIVGNIDASSIGGNDALTVRGRTSDDTANSVIFTDSSGVSTSTVRNDGVVIERVFTMATLPSVVNGGRIQISDTSRGHIVAISDGVNWKYASDGLTVS